MAASGTSRSSTSPPASPRAEEVKAWIRRRGYVRWLRLRRVAGGLRQGESLTASAHAAGFSDSAHLSRVFRSTFGVRPSEIAAAVQWHVGPIDKATDPFKPPRR